MRSSWGLEGNKSIHCRDLIIPASGGLTWATRRGGPRGDHPLVFFSLSWLCWQDWICVLCHRRPQCPWTVWGSMLCSLGKWAHTVPLPQFLGTNGKSRGFWEVGKCSLSLRIVVVGFSSAILVTSGVHNRAYLQFIFVSALTCKQWHSFEIWVSESLVLELPFSVIAQKGVKASTVEIW